MSNTGELQLGFDEQGNFKEKIKEGNDEIVAMNVEHHQSEPEACSLLSDDSKGFERPNYNSMTPVKVNFGLNKVTDPSVPRNLPDTTQWSGRMISYPIQPPKLSPVIVDKSFADKYNYLEAAHIDIHELPKKLKTEPRATASTSITGNQEAGPMAIPIIIATAQSADIQPQNNPHSENDGDHTTNTANASTANCDPVPMEIDEDIDSMDAEPPNGNVNELQPESLRNTSDGVNTYPTPEMSRPPSTPTPLLPPPPPLTPATVIPQNLDEKSGINGSNIPPPTLQGVSDTSLNSMSSPAVGKIGNNFLNNHDNFAVNDTYAVNRMHTIVQPFSCMFCTFRCSDPLVFRNHFSTHSEHLAADESLMCGLCRMQFVQPGELQQHLKQHNQLTLKCDKCSYESDTAFDMSSHMMTHPEVFMFNEPKWNYQRQKQLQYHCCNCDYHSDNAVTFSHHVLSHTKQCVCDKCGYICQNETLLNQHVRENHTEDTLVTCEFYDFKSPKKRAVDRKHCRQKPLWRMAGDYQTNKLKLINMRIKQHATIKIFSCKMCRYKTENKERFERHVNQHALGRNRYESRSMGKSESCLRKRNRPQRGPNNQDDYYSNRSKRRNVHQQEVSHDNSSLGNAGKVWMVVDNFNKDSDNLENTETNSDSSLDDAGETWMVVNDCDGNPNNLGNTAITSTDNFLNTTDKMVSNLDKPIDDFNKAANHFDKTLKVVQNLCNSTYNSTRKLLTSSDRNANNHEESVITSEKTANNSDKPVIDLDNRTNRSDKSSNNFDKVANNFYEHVITSDKNSNNLDKPVNNSDKCLNNSVTAANNFFISFDETTNNSVEISGKASNIPNKSVNNYNKSENESVKNSDETDSDRCVVNFEETKNNSDESVDNSDKAAINSDKCLENFDETTNSFVKCVDNCIKNANKSVENLDGTTNNSNPPVNSDNTANNFEKSVNSFHKLTDNSDKPVTSLDTTSISSFTPVNDSNNTENRSDKSENNSNRTSNNTDKHVIESDKTAGKCQTYVNNSDEPSKSLNNPLISSDDTADDFLNNCKKTVINSDKHIIISSDKTAINSYKSVNDFDKTSHKSKNAASDNSKKYDLNKTPTILTKNSDLIDEKNHYEEDDDDDICIVFERVTKKYNNNIPIAVNVDEIVINDNETSNENADRTTINANNVSKDQSHTGKRLVHTVNNMSNNGGEHLYNIFESNMEKNVTDVITGANNITKTINETVKSLKNDMEMIVHDVTIESNSLSDSGEKHVDKTPKKLVSNMGENVANIGLKGNEVIGNVDKTDTCFERHVETIILGVETKAADISDNGETLADKIEKFSEKIVNDVETKAADISDNGETSAGKIVKCSEKIVYDIETKAADISDNGETSAGKIVKCSEKIVHDVETKSADISDNGKNLADEQVKCFEKNVEKIVYCVETKAADMNDNFETHADKIKKCSVIIERMAYFGGETLLGYEKCSKKIVHNVETIATDISDDGKRHVDETLISVENGSSVIDNFVETYESPENNNVVGMDKDIKNYEKNTFLVENVNNNDKADVTIDKATEKYCDITLKTNVDNIINTKNTGTEFAISGAQNTDEIYLNRITDITDSNETNLNKTPISIPRLMVKIYLNKFTMTDAIKAAMDKAEIATELRSKAIDGPMNQNGGHIAVAKTESVGIEDSRETGIEKEIRNKKLEGQGQGPNDLTGIRTVQNYNNVVGTRSKRIFAADFCSKATGTNVSRNEGPSKKKASHKILGTGKSNVIKDAKSHKLSGKKLKKTFITSLGRSKTQQETIIVPKPPKKNRNKILEADLNITSMRSNVTNINDFPHRKKRNDRSEKNIAGKTSDVDNSAKKNVAENGKLVRHEAQKILLKDSKNYSAMTIMNRNFDKSTIKNINTAVKIDLGKLSNETIDKVASKYTKIGQNKTGNTKVCRSVAGVTSRHVGGKVEQFEETDESAEMSSGEVLKKFSEKTAINYIFRSAKLKAQKLAKQKSEENNMYGICMDKTVRTCDTPCDTRCDTPCDTRCDTPCDTRCDTPWWHVDEVVSNCEDDVTANSAEEMELLSGHEASTIHQEDEEIKESTLTETVEATSLEFTKPSAGITFQTDSGETAMEYVGENDLILQKKTTWRYSGLVNARSTMDHNPASEQTSQQYHQVFAQKPINTKSYADITFVTDSGQNTTRCAGRNKPVYDGSENNSNKTEQKNDEERTASFFCTLPYKTTVPKSIKIVRKETKNNSKWEITLY